MAEGLQQNADPGDAAPVIAALSGSGVDRVRIAHVDALEDVDLLLREQAQAHRIGLHGRMFGRAASAGHRLPGAHDDPVRG